VRRIAIVVASQWLHLHLQASRALNRREINPSEAGYGIHRRLRICCPAMRPFIGGKFRHTLFMGLHGQRSDFHAVTLEFVLNEELFPRGAGSRRFPATAPEACGSAGISHLRADATRPEERSCNFGVPA
jgi:hypothetical protein